MPVGPLARVRVSERGEVERLHVLAAAADGHPSLGDAVWRDLDRPGPDSIGFLAREAVEPGDRDRPGGHLGHGVAYVHIARTDTFAPLHWTLGLVIHPDHRNVDVAGAMLDAAVGHVASHGGGRAVLWLLGPSHSVDSAVESAGFVHDRDLLQLRMPIPPDATCTWPPNVRVRDFLPGRDDTAWLDVNNRAFGDHPEQGGWTEATLRRRIEEPWFDPSLFLLAFDSEGLAGFNWCRAHDEEGPDSAMGEIFVIGVDPRTQGTGLGRALAVAGLERLAQRGIRTGMLFVDAANVATLSLYRSLGFSVHRRDRAFRRDVAPA